jgi:hypothetical protein
MKADYEDASIELTPEEAKRLVNDKAFRDRVERKASDLADETDRTVLVADSEGKVIARYKDERGLIFD